jgi:hypothetical protein
VSYYYDGILSLPKTIKLKGGYLVTPDMVLSIDASLPLLSTATSNPSAQPEKGNNSPNTGVALSKDSKPTPVDTVSISTQSLQTVTEVAKKDARKEEANIINSSEISNQAAAKVEFVYDQKGELITKYMDTADRLIYQTPSELTLLLRETASKSGSSVDMKA